MISTSDFLAMMKAISAPAETGARVRLGTVDSGYVGGNPRVTFDGEGTLSGRGYAYLDSYLPFPGDRVALLEVGSTWLILGSIDSPTVGVPLQRIATNVNTSNTAAFTVETVTDSVTAPLVQGKTYEVTWQGNYTAASGTLLLWRIREDNLAGTQIGGGRSIWATASQVATPFIVARYTAVSTGNKTFVVTGSPAASTVRNGAASAPSVLAVTLAS